MFAKGLNVLSRMDHCAAAYGKYFLIFVTALKSSGL